MEETVHIPGPGADTLAAMAGVLPLAIQLIAVDGRSLLVNAAARSLLGELPLDWNVHTDPAAAERGLRAAFAEAVRAGRGDVPRCWWPGDDRRLAVEVTTVAVPAADGSVAHVVACFADVTAAMDLASDRDRLRALQLYSSELTTVRDANLAFVSVSPSVGRILGYTAEEYAARPPREQLHPDDWDRLTVNGAPTLPAPGETIVSQFRLHHADGSWRWMAMTWTNLLAHPSIRGLVSNLRDVTAFKEVEERLRRSEQELASTLAQLRQIIDLIPARITLRDAAGRFRLANQFAADEHGVTPAELEERPPSPGVNDARRQLDRDLAADDQVRATGQAIILPAEPEVHAGKPRVLHTIKIPFVGVAGVAGDSVLTIAVDVTERYRLEEQRLRNRELEAENRRVHEANRLKSVFLANMSHELRTPLNAIIGFAELLHDGAVTPTSPQHREFLGDILTSGQHLLRLINDVLDLAKVEAGKLEFRPEPVDVASLVGEVCAGLRAASEAKRIRLDAAVDPDVGVVTIDPARFKQVLYNYLSNALKFTPDTGAVEVRIRGDGDERFRLEVRDTGIGIAAADLGYLFNEFHQIEAGMSRRHGGTGLGLALTRRLVEAQGGAVGVDSQLGAGSVFHAVLPRRPHSNGRALRASEEL